MKRKRKEAPDSGGIEGVASDDVGLGLSEHAWRTLRREVRRVWGYTPRRLRCDGTAEDPAGDPLGAVPGVLQARRRAVEESLRWGDPYVFLLADGLMSWVVALVEGETLRGGLCGIEVVLEGDGLDVEATARLLDRWEVRPGAVCRALSGAPVWPRERVRAAAQSLAEIAYAVCGWNPERWRRNRRDAEQQRQIGEAIQQGKAAGLRPWPLAEERQLLQLIRAGDSSGARRHLNQLLAAMFLDSPRLPVLQARALELMGFLIRVAVEDEPGCAVLMDAHRDWMVRLIGTRSFESLCATVRDGLEDFMARVASQGLSPAARHVRRVLAFVEAQLPRAPTLDEAAAAAGISRFRLAHLLKETTGQPYGRHLARLRCEVAARRLLTTRRDCAEIAAELGFADQSHFTRVFRTVFGTTPARYRLDHGAGDPRPGRRPAPRLEVPQG